MANPIPITRAEYAAKFGAPATTSAPIPITRAEYQAKYGNTTTAPTPPKNSDQYTGAVNAIIAAKPAGETGSGFADAFKMIPNALGDVGNLIKGGTVDTAKNLWNIPGAIRDTVTDPAVQAHPVDALVGAGKGALDSLWGMVPQSAKDIGNTQAIADIPQQFHDLAKENGGYANALKLAIQAMPGAIPAAAQQYLEKIDQARQSIENHPVNEMLGYAGLKALAESPTGAAKSVVEGIKPAGSIIKQGAGAVVDTALHPIDTATALVDKMTTPTSHFNDNLNKALPVLKKDVNTLPVKQTDARTAFTDIVANKDNVGIQDANGEPKLPSTYSFLDTVKAQSARLKQVYQDYSAKLTTVDKAKFEGDIQQKVSDLIKNTDTQLAKENSSAGRSALTGIKNELGSLRDLSPAGIQSYIESIGKQTKVGPGQPPTLRQVHLANLGGEMRKILDESVAKIDGQGYQDLRNVYKAHKTIQSQMLQAAKSELNKTPGWTDRLSNLGMTAEGINFLMTHDPHSIAIGLGIKGSTMFTKYLRSPQRALSNMFKEVENAQRSPLTPSNINQSAAIVPSSTNIPTDIPPTVPKSTDLSPTAREPVSLPKSTVQKVKDTLLPPGAPREGGQIKNIFAKEYGGLDLQHLRDAITAKLPQGAKDNHVPSTIVNPAIKNAFAVMFGKPMKGTYTIKELDTIRQAASMIYDRHAKTIPVTGKK